MNLFGWKSRRAARLDLARPAIWWGAMPPDPPRDYATRVRAAYGANAIAQRACRMIADAVGGAPLIAEGDGVEALLRARSGGQHLLETAATQLLLHGNAYVQILPDAEGTKPGELYALRPDRATISLDARGWPLALAYRVGGEAVQLPFEEASGRIAITHIRLQHPIDDHYGMGVLDAADDAVRLHNAAARWNRGLIDNAARPSGALIYDPGEPGASLTPEQFERLRAEMAAQFQGGANAGRPLLLKAGSNGNRSACRPRTWTSPGCATGRRAKSPAPSACRRCCSACRAMRPTPIIARR